MEMAQLENTNTHTLKRLADLVHLQPLCLAMLQPTDSPDLKMSSKIESSCGLPGDVLIFFRNTCPRTFPGSVRLRPS